MNENLINTGIYIAYALIGISILAILLFAISGLIKKPEGAKTVLIGLVGLLAVLGITYATSSGVDATTIFADENIDEATSKRVGMGLTTFYVLAALTILSILYVEVTRLFK